MNTGIATRPLRVSRRADPAVTSWQRTALRALRQLPGAFRTVVYLADVEGYAYREIADLMGNADRDGDVPAPPRPPPATGASPRWRSHGAV